MDTVEYYNKNSKSFIEDTLNVDLITLYEHFTKHLPEEARVLDLGCGTGRDSLAFMKMGYQVDAIDASAEMVQHAKALTGLDVSLMRFEEIDFVERYDAIWACASLLHVPLANLRSVITKIVRALKPRGILYVSFKYGTEERIKGGRHFTDLDELALRELIDTLDLELLSSWITEDRRPDRDDKWLNSILRKID